MVSFRFKKTSPFKHHDGKPQTVEFTIDELARAANTTVRNVRAYQDRGLLSPPERRGRVGIYNDVHLGRLRLIGQLLGRGYTLNNIQELLTAVEAGHDLRQLLGLANAISSPWSDEIPRHFTALHLATLFGVHMKRSLLSKAIDMGLLEPDGLRYRAPNPKILIAGGALAKEGIPLEELLDVIALLRNHLEEFADKAVQLCVRELDKYGDGLPPMEDVPRLSSLVWKIRPLAMMAIESEVSRALEGSANKFMGDRVAKIFEHIMEHSPTAPLPPMPSMNEWMAPAPGDAPQEGDDPEAAPLSRP